MGKEIKSRTMLRSGRSIRVVGSKTVEDKPETQLKMCGSEKLEGLYTNITLTLFYLLS